MKFAAVPLDGIAQIGNNPGQNIRTEMRFGINQNIGIGTKINKAPQNIAAFGIVDPRCQLSV